MTKLPKSILILLFSILSIHAKADSVQYSDSILIKVESANFIVIHSHDWSENEIRPWLCLSKSKKIHHVKEFGTLRCIDKKSGKTIFKRKCPPLNHLEISADEKFITGLSTIKLFNPTQLIIYSTKGKLLKERHICLYELSFNRVDYRKFKWKHIRYLLENKHKTYKLADTIFIDFQSTDLRSAKLLRRYDIRDYKSWNHLSGYFSESVTNWVFWYNESNLEIKYNTFNGKLFSISLLDTAKQRFEIMINE